MSTNAGTADGAAKEGIPPGSVTVKELVDLGVYSLRTREELASDFGMSRAVLQKAIAGKKRLGKRTRRAFIKFGEKIGVRVVFPIQN